METVTIEEAQARLAELIERVAQGETVIIEAPDHEQIQLVRLREGAHYAGRDDIRYYRSRAQQLEAAAGIVYYPDTREAPRRPRRFGSAAGQISMADNFDEPLEELKEYTE